MDNKIEIQATLIRQLYSSSRMTLVSGVILAAILAYMQFGVIGFAVVFSWFSLIVLVSIIRAYLVSAYHRCEIIDITVIRTWLVRFRLGVLASGIAWGASSYLLFPADHPQNQLFLVFMLAGLTAGGLATYSADMISAVIFNASVLVPLIIRLSIPGDSLSVAMSIALMLYFGFILISLRYINRNVRENISLRLEASAREKEARINEQRYRLLLNHSPVGIVHYDAGLIITFCNDRFAEILRSPPERLIGLDMKKIKDHSILPAMRKALAGEIGFYEGHYSATISDANGWISMTCAPSLDIETKIVSGVAIVQDITERKQIENALKESEEKLRGLYELSPLGIALTDMEGNYLEFNQSFQRICGYSENELKSLDYWALTPKKYAIEEAQQIQSLLNTSRYGPYEKEYMRKDGTLVPLCLNGMLVTGNDGRQYIWSIVEDITERKLAETAIRESHQQIHSLLNSMAEGAYGADTNGNCTFVNRSFLRILGYEHGDEIIGKHIHTLIHHSHSDGSPYPASECKMYNAYRQNQEIHVSDEVFWDKSGTSIPVEYWSQPIMVDGVMQGAIATFIDITERKLAEAHIHNLAFYDTLTKLPNRRLLNDRLGRTLASSKRNGLYGALMFLDLDNFKPLNDTYGHGMGDLLLIEAASRISSCIRETDTAARFGGDEFVVMLSDLHEDQVESTAQVGIVAEKIRASISEPYLLIDRHAGNKENSVEHHCTASIGAVVFNYKANRENILKWADMAMYQAKESGRNRVQINQQGNCDFVPNDHGDMILGLIWHEAYECGEATIDQQHRKLFELADRLIESAFTRDENPKQFDFALNKLLAHVVQHFADEEAVLALHRYASLEEHTNAHKRLIERALELRDAAASGGVTIGELANFLANEVVAQHMLKEDRKFYPLFKEVSQPNV
jgi:diguanylate cyclase (GGDEF)-like protein/hemerythrin-like metal-binding protein/PAS domain S-box-containing protein